MLWHKGKCRELQRTCPKSPLQRTCHQLDSSAKSKSRSVVATVGSPTRCAVKQAPARTFLVPGYEAYGDSSHGGLVHLHGARQWRTRARSVSQSSDVVAWLAELVLGTVGWDQLVCVASTVFQAPVHCMRRSSSAQVRVPTSPFASHVGGVEASEVTRSRGISVGRMQWRSWQSRGKGRAGVGGGYHISKTFVFLASETFLGCC